MQDDSQLLGYLPQYIPDNDDELITPANLRFVLAAFVEGKVSRDQLANFAQLANPRFSGVPQVPTAPAGTNSDQVASTAYVLSAVASVAGGKNLNELVLPQDVQGGTWYLTSTGVWEARRNFRAEADPINGPNWLLKASFGGQLTSIPAANITDATDAGRAMLTAPSASAQRALVGNLNIPAGRYGNHPALRTEDGPDGGWAYVLKALSTLANVQVVQQSGAPTVTGFLPASAAVGATVTITGSLFTKATAVTFNGTAALFQVLNASTIVATVPAGATTGPVAVSNDNGTGTSAANFTVVATATPTPAGDTVAPNISFTVPAAGATLTPGTQVPLTVNATDNVAVQGVTFTNGATGEVLGIGAKNGNSYTIPYTPATAGPLSFVATAMDAAGNSQSATVNVTVQASTTTPTNTTPDAPFPTYDPVTRVLTFQHALGTSELEYNRFGGTFTSYAPIQVDDSSHSAGEWKARVKAYAAGNRNASGTADSPAIAAKTVTVNQIPTANAGQDITITAATKSVALLGNGVDPEGKPVTYFWEQLAGPTGAGNVTGMPASTKNVVISDYMVGNYQFELTVTDDQGATASDFVVLTVNAAPTTGGSATTITAGPGTMRFSTRNQDVAGGFILRHALAAMPVLTDASQFTFIGKTNYESQFLANAQLTVHVNGAFFGVYSFNQAGAEQQFTCTGLPAGSKLIEVYEGAPYRQNEVGDVRVCQLVSATFPAGSSAVLAMPVKSTRALIIGGDSRTVGGGVLVPSRDASSRILGRQLNQDVYLLGYASWQLGAHLLTPEGQDAQVAEMVAISQGHAEQDIWLEGGYNDYKRMAITPSQLTAAYQSLLPKIHQALPKARVFIQTDIPAGDESAQHGYTNGQWRAAEAAGASGLTYATVADATQAGLNLSTHYYEQIGIHLNVPGELVLAAWMRGVLSGTSGGGSGGTGAYINQVTATQVGHQLRIAATGSGAVEYRLDNGSWAAWQLNDGTNYQGPGFFDTPYGPHTVWARLVNNPTVTSSVQVVVNPLLLRDAAGIARIGNWVEASGGAINGAYTVTPGSYWELDTSSLPAPFHDVVGIKVNINPTDADHEQDISLNGGPTTRASITAYGTGIYIPRAVYTSPLLPAGALKARGTYTGTGSMSYNNIELILGDPTAAAPGGTTTAPDSRTPLSDVANNIVANGNFATNATWGLGSSATTIDNGGVFTNANGGASSDFSQNLILEVGRRYKVTLIIRSITSGKVSVLNNNSGQASQIDFSNGDATNVAGTITKEFTATSANDYWVVRGSGGCNAVIGLLSVVPI